MKCALIAAGSLLLLQLSSVSAHEFPPPNVSVTISNLTPNGHPDLRTEIDIPTGPGFDLLRVDSPHGSRIAADADIPDGTIVGRLDAEATTNAFTRPACDLHVAFSVPITEATTDPASPEYPEYLNDLAPGQHQLRLVANVSPSADTPISINYLFDIEAPSGPIINDPSVGHIVSRVIVGNPLDPPEQFRSCTPQRSINTLYGKTPDGTALLTAGPTPFDGPLLFTFDFTSRPDDDGGRHDTRVEVLAGTISPPDDFVIGLAPAPTDVRVSRTRQGALVLSWNYPVSDGAFQVDVIKGSDGTPYQLTVYSSLSVEIPAELLPVCPSAEQLTLRIFRISVQTAEPAEITVNPCGIVPADITAPFTGAGSARLGSSARAWATLSGVGAAMVLIGAALRVLPRPRSRYTP